MTACLPRPLLAPLRSAIRQTTTLHPSNGNPSMYQHTPNAPAGSAQNPGKPLNSGWGNVTPFTMRSSCQFLSLPGASQTPPLGSAQYDADLLQVGALGGTTSIQRTVQETDQARFWADSIGTWTPSGQWPILSDVVVQNNNLTTLQTARLSALVGASLADAGIAAWEAKYTYNTARPITEIQESTDPAIADPLGSRYGMLRTSPAICRATAPSAPRRRRSRDFSELTRCRFASPPIPMPRLCQMPSVALVSSIRRMRLVLRQVYRRG